MARASEGSAATEGSGAVPATVARWRRAVVDDLPDDYDGLRMVWVIGPGQI
jgi:hypothetical protein